MSHLTPIRLAIMRLKEAYEVAQGDDTGREIAIIAVLDAQDRLDEALVLLRAAIGRERGRGVA